MKIFMVRQFALDHVKDNRGSEWGHGCRCCGPSDGSTLRFPDTGVGPHGCASRQAGVGNTPMEALGAEP